MKRVTVAFTPEELSLLSSLASEELFRREFIDRRLPGHEANPAQLSLGKQIVERLRLLTDRAKGTRDVRRNGTARGNAPTGGSRSGS